MNTEELFDLEAKYVRKVVKEDYLSQNVIFDGKNIYKHYRTTKPKLTKKYSHLFYPACVERDYKVYHSSEEQKLYVFEKDEFIFCFDLVWERILLPDQIINKYKEFLAK